MNVKITAEEKSIEIRYKNRSKKCFAKKIFITIWWKSLEKNSEEDLP